MYKQPELTSRKIVGVTGSSSAMVGTPAGMAGMSARAAHAYWAEESRHLLKSPGAYEWWYFHAMSPQGDGVELTLFEGLPFHPSYFVQATKHAGRAGAKAFDKASPKLQASHYPAAYFTVYQTGKKIARFLNLYPPETTEGQRDVPDIRIGPNRITLRQDGSFGIVARGYPFEMARGRPRRVPGQTLSAQLTFTPATGGVQHVRPFRAANADGATHQWILAAPLGRMTGHVQLLDTQQDVAALDLRIDSPGYHDHVYGHGPLGQGIDKMLWGYVQGEDWAAAWHQSIARGKSRDRAEGLIFFQQNKPPVIIESPDARLELGHMSRWLMRHPGRVTLHGSDEKGHPIECVINHNSVLESAPFHTHLAAAGTVNIPGRGHFAGAGVTHVLKLQRLGWPVMSDMTHMAITTVAEDDPLWRE